MTKLLAFMVVVVGVLLATPAQAWVKLCQDTGTDETNMSLKPGEFACWTFNHDDDISGYLSVNACENIDVFFNSDTAATTTVNQIAVWNCSVRGAAATTSNCDPTTDGAFDLDGSTFTLTNIFGLSAVWLAIDVIDWTTPDVPLVKVKCNGPTGFW